MEGEQTLGDIALEIMKNSPPTVAIPPVGDNTSNLTPIQEDALPEISSADRDKLIAHATGDEHFTPDPVVLNESKASDDTADAAPIIDAAIKVLEEGLKTLRNLQEMTACGAIGVGTAQSMEPKKKKADPKKKKKKAISKGRIEEFLKRVG